MELSRRHWWVFALGGIAAWALMLAMPAAGALVVDWLIATYAIVFGVLLIALAVRLHGLAGRHHAMGTA